MLLLLHLNPPIQYAFPPFLFNTQLSLLLSFLFSFLFYIRTYIHINWLVPCSFKCEFHCILTYNLNFILLDQIYPFEHDQNERDFLNVKIELMGLWLEWGCHPSSQVFFICLNHTFFFLYSIPLSIHMYVSFHLILSSLQDIIMYFLFFLFIFIC